MTKKGSHLHKYFFFFSRTPDLKVAKATIVAPVTAKIEEKKTDAAITLVKKELFFINLAYYLFIQNSVLIIRIVFSLCPKFHIGRIFP